MPTPALSMLMDAFGWLGAIGGLVAYGLVTRGVWQARGLPFQLTNLTSAALLCTMAGYREVWPSVAANTAWIVIGVYAIALIIRNKWNTRRYARPAIHTGTVTRLHEDRSSVAA